MVAKVAECTDGDVDGWICGRATHLRTELDTVANNPILVTSGGIGGDYSHGCNFIAAATNCTALDAIAVHRYASVPGYWADNAVNWVAEAGGKLVYLEEWGINAASYNQTTAFASETADMNSVGFPSLYWEIILPPVAACPYDAATDSGDQFGIPYDSGIDLAGPMHQAAKTPALQNWPAWTATKIPSSVSRLASGWGHY